MFRDFNVLGNQIPDRNSQNVRFFDIKLSGECCPVLLIAVEALD